MRPCRFTSRARASHHALAAASSTSNSRAKVVARHNRVVASFEHGPKSSWAIIAMTKSRSRHGRDASNASTPSLGIVSSTAWS